jgi:hypothetical protein
MPEILVVTRDLNGANMKIFDVSEILEKDVTELMAVVTQSDDGSVKIEYNGELNEGVFDRIRVDEKWYEPSDGADFIRALKTHIGDSSRMEIITRK